MTIDYARLYSADLPAPAARWTPFPKYYFIGGNNDPEQIPVEGFIDAAARVLRRDGHKLAIYNLGLGPQGYPPLRRFVSDKCQRHRGIKASIDDIPDPVVITVYADWLAALPESLLGGSTAEALEAIVELDLTDLAGVEPPRGYGRD